MIPTLDAPSRSRLACLVALAALLAGPAAAQGPAVAQAHERAAPPRVAGQGHKPAARPPGAARPGSFYLKPETEAAARASDAKMEALRSKMDARVSRVTRSICAGCVDARRPANRGAPVRTRARGEREEFRPADPAEAPRP